MRKRIKQFVVICMLAVFVIGSIENGIVAEAAENPTELSGEIEVIFNRGEADMSKYIEAFEQKYPEVDVTYTNYSDFETAIKTRMEEGDYGDVLYVPSFLSHEECLNYFEPLGSYKELEQKYNYLEYGIYDGDTVYGIPSSAYLIGMIYNKEVFDKAGISELPDKIDEFMTAMELIKAHTDAIPFYTGYTEPWTLQYWELFPYIEMTGNPAYRYEDFITTVNPFSEGSTHYSVFRLLYDMVQKGYTEVGVQDVTWGESLAMINQGEIACAAVGTWALAEYKRAGENGDNIGFMPFPNSIYGNQYVTVTADYSYAVAQNSDNKEAAKAFVSFILDESGYAFDHETISVLKADPIPESYGDMTQMVMRNSVSPSDEANGQYWTLATNLNLHNQVEALRVVEAAAGKREEDFEDIIADWNARWESSRAPWMKTEVESVAEEAEDMIVSLENQNVELSESEKQYVEQNPVLRVGFHRNMAPLSYEIDGEFLGVANDICNLIAEKTGLQVQAKGYLNVDELTKALENNEIDMIAGIERADEYSGITYSKEYLTYMEVLVRHNTMTSENQKRAAVVNGDALRTEGATQSKAFFSGMDKCIEGVHSMTADYVITNYYTANYYMKEQGYTDISVLPYASDRSYHIGFGENTNPILVAICNKCIYSIPKGQMQIGLLNHMDSVVEEISIQSFFESNPLVCLTFILVMLLSLFGGVVVVLYEREKSNRTQALAAKRYERLSELADEYFFEYEYRNDKLSFDVKFQQVFGFEGKVIKNAYKGRNALFIQFLGQIEEALNQNSNAQFNISLDKEGEGKQWYRVVTSIIHDKNEKPVHLIGKLVNIQREMEEVENYQNKAYKDTLTKLYNREGLNTNIPNGRVKDVVLAVVDLDDFKKVNDTLGHGGGDYVLMFLADKLREYMGEDALVARYGGDEFVILLTGTTKEEAEEKLALLVKAMDVPIFFGGNTRDVSISVGALYSPELGSFEMLFQAADEVLYRKKESGKNGYLIESFES